MSVCVPVYITLHVCVCATKFSIMPCSVVLPFSWACNYLLECVCSALIKYACDNGKMLICFRCHRNTPLWGFIEVSCLD